MLNFDQECDIKCESQFLFFFLIKYVISVEIILLVTK